MRTGEKTRKHRQRKDRYIGAEKIEVSHSSLKEKDRCPACGKGKLYILEPAAIIRITGNAQLAAKVYELERLRCNLCGQILKKAILHRKNSLFYKTEY